ncbi:MAG: putative DNA binding domain-containing protein [Lachnospiraceae bacterium]|nr:putative DNA binding domain-containing protein [Lachnospiraceae bacterium]
MNLGIEDEYTEFKESLSQLDKGLKSITAMLNKHGVGSVYYGVSDNGDVCGMDIGKNTLMDIRNRIRDKIEPRIYAEIKDYTAENGKKYIKVSAKGTDIPYSYDGRYYVRNVSADEQASNEILRKMLASSDADIIRQKTAPAQQLSFKSFFALLSGLGIHPKDSTEFYNNYGLLNRENKYNINAYLMSDNNDISIKVVVFEGTNKSVMSKRTEYGNKCLLISVSEVLEFFSSVNTTRVDVSGMQRKEQPLFDFPSFREAWINACLHNDWNEGIAPSVYLFDDRIEIVSYGGLPYSLSREGFFAGTSVPVNKSLLLIFMATKYAEQSGHGVPTIVEKYGREVFAFDDGMIKVTIPLSYEREDVVQRKNKIKLGKGLTINQTKVLELLKKNPAASLQDVATDTELSLSGVKKICTKLQEIGLLEREGSKRDGKWIVK